MRQALRGEDDWGETFMSSYRENLGFIRKIKKCTTKKIGNALVMLCITCAQSFKVFK